MVSVHCQQDGTGWYKQVLQSVECISISSVRDDPRSTWMDAMPSEMFRQCGVGVGCGQHEWVLDVVPKAQMMPDNRSRATRN